MKCSKWIRDRGGMSVVELIVAIAIVSVSLLAVAAAGGAAAQHVARGRVNLSRWAAIQQQMESISAQGHSKIINGSTVVQGYPMTWTITGSDLKRVTLMVDRNSFSGEAVRDTLIFYLAAY